MRKVILIALMLWGVAQAQTPTGVKTRFPGIWYSSRDTTTGSGDTLAVIWNRADSSLYMRSRSYWKKIATNVSDSGYLTVIAGRALIHDSLQGLYSIKAGTSAGGHILSNSGTVVSEWGLGGSANMDFHGFAGYDVNRSSSYTARSFTDKNYVDSADLLRVKYSDTASMLTPYPNYTALNSLLGLKFNISDTALLGGTNYYNKTYIDANLATKVATSRLINTTYPLRGGGDLSADRTLNIDTGRTATAIVTGGDLNKVRDSLSGISSAALALKVNYTDTATMLSSYYNKTATDSKLALKLNISDTAAMLGNYYNKTASDSRFAPISGSVNYIQNGTSQQSSSNFNISGNGTIGGIGQIGSNLIVNGISTLGTNAIIGSTTGSEGISINKNFSTNSQIGGVDLRATLQSTITSLFWGFSTSIGTQAISFTNSSIIHYHARQSTFGAGSSVTNQSGFEVQSTLIGAANNYGFKGNIASGSNRWNLYMNGTASNYLQGTTLIGTTTDNGTDKLQVNGTVSATKLNGLYVNYTAANNIYAGNLYSPASITGAANLLIGKSGNALTSGTYNVFIMGDRGANSATTASYNIAIGGDYVLGGLTTGNNNVALGTQAGQYITTESYNTLIGMYSGGSLTASNNTFVGFYTGWGITTGTFNTIVASNGSTFNSTGITTGSYNTILGNPTGLATGTTSNIILADGSGNIKYRWDGTTNNLYGTATISSSVTASSFIKSGGTSSQYLMADGSVSTGGAVAASGTLTSQSTSTTMNVCTYTAPADGLYEVGGAASYISGTGTTPSIELRYSYTNEQNTASTNNALGSTGTAGQSIVAGAGASSRVIYVKGGTTITLLVAALSGTPTFNASGFIRKSF